MNRAVGLGALALAAASASVDAQKAQRRSELKQVPPPTSMNREDYPSRQAWRAACRTIRKATR